MKESKLPPLQKLIASFFVLVFIASLLFIGYRIYTKSAYEAHEAKQARLLAVSAISLFGEKTSKDPEMWTKFESNEIELMIDHMRIKENWVVKVNFLKKENHIQVLSSVNSGWNSRSPQFTEFRAKIFNDGSLEFENAEAALTAADNIERTRQKASGKMHNFRFSDERIELPAVIDAEETLFTDAEGNEFLILKEPLKTGHNGLPSE